MKRYYLITAIFTVILITGIFFTIQRVGSEDAEVVEGPTESDFERCIEAAETCRDEGICGPCHDACTDIKNIPIAEGIIEQCRLGNPGGVEQIMNEILN